MKATTYHSSKHLSSEDVYSTLGKCPICGFTGDRAARVTIQKNPTVSLLLCPRCRGLSASHMPSAKTLGDFYDSYYANYTHAHVTLYKPERLARRLVREVDVDKDHEFRIMDLGGGDGTISILTARRIASMQKRDVSIEIVDYHSGEPPHEDAISIKFVNNLDDATPNCDLIIASAVFEHIPDLLSTLPKIFQKLRPGGILYARTPYMYPMIKFLHFDMTYPGHVHDLGDEFWSTLPSWLPVPVKLVRSRPSIIESGFLEKSKFFRTLIACLFKTPTYVENLYPHRLWWKFYGGWEVILRRLN